MTKTDSRDTPPSQIRYDLLVEEALRDVVRLALIEIEDKGLPGDHHFYITFSTEAPGVVIPDSLKKRYPEEMTIILQHQFWDLQVTDRHFSVALSFSGTPTQLVIPFAAILSFSDPSVRFGLQFNRPPSSFEVEAELEEYLEREVEKELLSLDGLSLEKPQRPTAQAKLSEVKTESKNRKASTAPGKKAPSQASGDAREEANVVTLESFRNKKP